MNDSALNIGSNSKFKPRAIFIDTDNLDIDKIKKGKMKDLFN